MKKLILEWLFGTDDIKPYMELLRDSMSHHVECIELIEDHKETLERSKENLNTILKLIKICENHGIDVDEEIKHVELNEVNANETLD